MLIGMTGKFTLLPPFNTYSLDGLTGKIVEVSFFNHLESKGRGIEELIYKPVNGEGYYSSDRHENLVVVTIEVNGGKKYIIPVKYIPNIYDNNVAYVNTYATIDLGELPITYDYDFIRDRISNLLTNDVGKSITPDDVYISSDFALNFYSENDSKIKELERIRNQTTNSSDLARVRELESALGIANNKISSLAQAVILLKG